jgi:putative membrane protein
MKHLADKFLSESDKEKIVNAVKEAEKKTSGEIVPMIVSYSHTYPVSNFMGGFMFGLIFSLLAVFIFKNENLWFFLSIFMPAFFIMYLIVKYSLPVKRLLISHHEINAEVEEAAINQFFKHHLNRTKDQTGILLYISLFERKVWLLADHGINIKVNKSDWQDIVNTITDGIKGKQHGESIAKAIKRIGDILCTHFPCKKDDTDELSNLILED